ncbi:hypothetical protein [Microtetraspora malaysiensis]|uniref:hypothetical protein n=1 Tax=Microtetraspora malaysiensis TaxID=161358 RepID=UPI0008354C99|nr:hypothetical protein [Microtetraspora malaysiensis]
MRSSTVVLGLAVVIGVGTALPSAASATVAPASATSVASASSPQPWGPYRSSGRKAWAAGKASFTGSGLRVYGYLYDARGTRECSWLKLRGLSDRLKYRTVTYRNCSSSRPRAFSVNFGYALKAQAKVCRGTSTRITGKCSPWASVWRQGGY